MKKLISTGRVVGLSVALLLLLCVYFVFLYKLQIIEGAAYYEQSINSQSTVQAVSAARGNILDRYGRTLISNKPSYNITLNEQELFYKKNDNAYSNSEIISLIKTVEECGESYTDTLPITKTSPFEYTEMTQSQRAMLDAYLNDKGLDVNTSAVELMSYMRTRYEIDNNYTSEETRKIAGIRYEINARYTPNYYTADYIFVEDAGTELLTKLMERDTSAVNVQTAYVREYNTRYGAHILGFTGDMTPEEYQTYKTMNYSMNAKVGKEGAEYAFENYLQGKNGLATITTTSQGTVTDTIYTTEPEPGDNVYLTIDLVLQEATEIALASGAEELQQALEQKAIEENGTYDYEDANNRVTGAAAVVIDVKTGEPLAMASYPTYDITTYNEKYNELKDAQDAPLYNRATNGTYAPGSTFKPCVAIAALTEGTINTQTNIRCDGVFKKYADTGYAPVCWYYGSYGLTHGDENVTTAVRDSCNIFFYTIGDELGISKLDEYAAYFGLGESTGIELPEKLGNMADPESHVDIQGVEWYLGDTVQAAIGQSDSLFTPLQLAEYCATVANGGTRHSASILKTVRTYDYSETVFSREAEVLSEVKSDDYNWKAVQEGMRLVAADPNGSAYQTFYNYPVSVAAKTGTAQRGAGISNNGVFICYAPFDDPQVAIAIVVEKAGAGASLAPIAREILDVYFSTQSALDTNDSELTLLK